MACYARYVYRLTQHHYVSLQIQHTDRIQCTAEVTDAPPNSLAVAAAGSLLSVPLADTKPDGTHTAPSAVLPLSLTKVILAECMSPC